MCVATQTDDEGTASKFAQEESDSEDDARAAEKKSIPTDEPDAAADDREDEEQALENERQRKSAELDLFAVCAELGEMAEEYDPDTDSMKPTFTRGEDCLECVRQISRYDCPQISCFVLVAQWRLHLHFRA